MFDYDFKDLVDTEQLRRQMQLFYSATKVPVGIVDFKMNVNISFGRIDLFENIGSENIETKGIDEIDTAFQPVIKTSNTLPVQAKDGIWSLITPIKVQGKPVAKLITGKFILESGDLNTDEIKIAEKIADADGFFSDGLKPVSGTNIEYIASIAEFYSNYLNEIISSNLIKIKQKQDECEHNSITEDRLRLALEFTDVVIWDVDIKSNSIYLSPNIDNILGYTPEKIPTNFNSFESILHPDDLSKTDKQFKDYISGKSKNLNLTVRAKKEDNWIWIELTGKSLKFDINQKPERVFGTLKDVSGSIVNSEQLIEANKMLQLVIDNIPQYIFWKDENSVYLGCNTKFAKGAGLNAPSEIIGKTDYDLAWTKEESDSYRMYDRKVMDNNRAELGIIEQQLQSDGRQVWVETNKLPLVDDDNNVVGIIGTFEDITERQKAIEALERENNLFTNGPVIVIRWSPEDTFPVEYITPNISQFGYTQEDFLSGRKSFVDIIHPQDRKRVLNEVSGYKRSNQDYYEQNYRIFTADGDLRWLADFTKIIKDENNNVLYHDGYVLDITEKKNAEEAIKVNQARFRTIINNTPNVAIQGYDSNGKVSFWNTASQKIFGITEDEAIGKSLNELFFDDESYESFMNVIKEIDKNGNSFGPSEWYFFDKVGNRRTLYSTIFPIYLEDGEKEFICVDVEISQLKLIEEALRQSEENISITLDSIGDAVITTDNRGNVLRLNPVAEELTGFTCIEALSQPIENIFNIRNSQTGEPAEIPIAKVMREGKIVGLANHTELISKDGKCYQIADSAAPVRKENGEIIGIVMVFRDITDIYKKENDLRLSEERLRKAQSVAHFGYIEMDSENKLIASDEAYKIFGLENNIRELDSSVIMEIIFPSEIERLKNLFYSMIENNQPFETDFKIKRINDGETRVIHAKTETHDSLNIKSSKFIVTIQDITEQKLAEEIIRENEEKYRILFEKTEDATLIIEDFGFVDCNEATLKMLGYNLKSDIIGKYPWELSPPLQHDSQTSKEKATEMLNLARKNGNHRFEWLHRRSNGEDFYVEVLLTTMNFRGKAILHTVWRDITDRKLIEEELRRSEEKFSISFMAAPFAISISTLDEGVLIDVNNSFATLFGYDSTRELIGRETFDIGLYKSYDEQDKIIKTLLEQRFSIQNKEWSIRRRDGKQIDTMLSAEIINISGQPHVLTMQIDISERKKAEEVIRTNELRYRLLFKHSPVGFIHYDKNLSITDYNERILEIIKTTPDGIKEINKDTLQDKRILNAMFAPFEGREGYYEGDYHLSTVNQKIFISLRTSPLYDENSEIQGGIAIIEDVSKRKWLELIQEIIYEIAIAANTSDDMNTLSQIIQLQLGKIIDTTNFFIAFYDEESDTISLPYYIDELDPESTFPAGKTMTSYVIKNDIPLLVDESEIQKLVHEGKVEIFGSLAKVWLGVPLKTGSRVIGAVVAQSYTDADAFKADDLKILQFVSEQIAHALGRKRVEQLLRESEEKFRTLTDQLPVGVYRTDKKGHILLGNPALAQMLEYESIKELMNVPMNDVYMTHRDVQKQFEQWLKSPDGIATNEIRLKTRNGKEIIVQDTYRIIFEENEDIIYFDGVLENITEKKLAEEEIHKLNNELKKLNSELEERITQRTEELETTLVELQYENDERKRTQDELYKANQKITNALEKEKELSELKTRFMSMISHEYRTPLTVILNSTYIIEKLYDGLRKLEFDDYLNKIRISIKGMTGLLEEVLLIGKSEAGKLYYTPAQLDLVPLCRSIIEETYLVDKKRHQIIFLHNSEKIVFESDEKLMKQIIGNLVSNAVKYSIENMPVTLEVIDTVDQVMINVSDKGIGISADDQKLLFDPFHRGKNIGQISGTGLGLTIVKRCADVLKATVNLQSEVNVGTTINIIIPKKK